MKYSYKDIQSFLSNIDRKTSENTAMLSELNDSLKSYNESRDNMEIWDADEASGSDEISLILSQIKRAKDYHARLIAARFRCNNGTYGICRTSGELIPRERLMAHPCATETIKQKQCR